MTEQNLIYVQQPSDKTKLLQLLNEVPASVLGTDYKAILWLDELKKVANNLNSTPLADRQ